MPKRDKMYAHYTEFDIKFTIRNRMQARITFIMLNDSTENYTEMIKTENSGVRNLDFYSYLNDRYQKLAGKLSKIVINGIKCLEPEDAPSFYSPPLPFEEIEISATIAKCLNTELNYLRCVDKDREHFSLVRPYNENAILINVIRFILRSKFAFLEGESEVSDCNREKTQICQRVDRTGEVRRIERRGEFGSLQPAHAAAQRLARQKAAEAPQHRVVRAPEVVAIRQCPHAAQIDFALTVEARAPARRHSRDRL